MKLIVHGAGGHMGQHVCALAESGFAGAELAGRVSPRGADGAARSLSELNVSADCVVDFSHHESTGALLDYCEGKNLPVVIATTGQTPEELARIREAAERIPVFYSANMSVGIALLADMAKRAAAAFPGADIEIVETHHHRKIDVPSGTALLLGHSIQEVRPDSVLLIGRNENGRRTAREIGIHSIRMGNEVGTHEIILSDGSETLTLKHQAEDRSLFARGALTAAAFLCGKAPGFYSMRDIL